MKHQHIERYYTFNPLNKPTFDQFKSQSLMMRLDAIETFVKEKKPASHFADLAEHHIRETVSYLRQARALWQMNTIGSSLNDVHRLALAAAHYCHSRLIPAFHASNIAKLDWILIYQNYLSIEDSYLHTIEKIQRESNEFLDKSANQIFQSKILKNKQIILLYEAAVVNFCGEIENQLEWVLGSSKG